MIIIFSILRPLQFFLAYLLFNIIGNKNFFQDESYLYISDTVKENIVVK